MSYEAVRDPSIAYQLEIVNNGDEPLPYNSTLEFGINPLTANTLWGELSLDLIDADGDGSAYLIGDFGSEAAIQAVGVSSSSGTSSVLAGPPLGEVLPAPGLYTFTVDPMAGPTLPDGDTLWLRTALILSPGDSVVVNSRFVIDEGTGIPFAEIPPLPDPAGGPFTTIINVPDEVLGDNEQFGSQTQLNVFQGGTVGTGFTAGDPLYDVFDLEVNILGGTVGDEFQAHSGAVVNISGGTVDFNFQAGQFNGTSHDVVVNISGGNVGDNFQANPGSVVNISGGTTSNIVARGSVLNISGGVVNTFTSNSIRIENGSVANISGGSFASAGRGLHVGFAAGVASVANIYGGALVNGNIAVASGNELNLFGTEFSLDGVAIEGLELGEALEIAQRDVTLSGVLTDGSSFSIDLNSQDPFPEAGDWIHATAHLTVTRVLPGDFNFDGAVDAADYVVWRKSTAATSDYATWKAKFGNGSGGGGLAAVPEPSAMMLAGLLGGMMTIGRRARRMVLAG